MYWNCTGENGRGVTCIEENKSVLFNLLKLTVTLSKLGEGGIQDSQVFTIKYLMLDKTAIKIKQDVYFCRVRRARPKSSGQNLVQKSLVPKQILMQALKYYIKKKNITDYFRTYFFG